MNSEKCFSCERLSSSNVSKPEDRLQIAFFAANNLQAGAKTRISRGLIGDCCQCRFNIISTRVFNFRLFFFGKRILRGVATDYSILTKQNKNNISNFSRLMSFYVACYHGLLLSRWKKSAYSKDYKADFDFSTRQKLKMQHHN